MKTTPYCGVNAFCECEQEERKRLLLIGKNTPNSRVGETGGEHNDVKKKVYGILLIAAALTVLLLTLQVAAGTVKLSERKWNNHTGRRKVVCRYGLYKIYGRLGSLSRISM